MALTDTAIRAAKPREKNYKIADEKGLYLLVTPQGAKRWCLKYHYLGKEKKLSFGAQAPCEAPGAPSELPRFHLGEGLRCGRGPPFQHKIFDRRLSDRDQRPHGEQAF